MWILTNYHTSLRSGFINRDIWLKRYLNCNKIRCDILTTGLIIIYDYGSIASMLLTVYIFITQLLLCLCVYARVSLIIRFIFVNPLERHIAWKLHVPYCWEISGHFLIFARCNSIIKLWKDQHNVILLFVIITPVHRGILWNNVVHF